MLVACGGNPDSRTISSNVPRNYVPPEQREEVAPAPSLAQQMNEYDSSQPATWYETRINALDRKCNESDRHIANIAAAMSRRSSRSATVEAFTLSEAVAAFGTALDEMAAGTDCARFLAAMAVGMDIDMVGESPTF